MKMKKNNLLILAVAALGFAACSSDETTAVNEKLAESNAISFRANVNGQMRAADINATTLETTGFYVSARKHSPDAEYFTDAAYTIYETPGGVKTWTCATKYYWPSDNSELDFYAYSPKAIGEGHNAQITAHANYKTFTVQPSTTISEQVDLIFANTNQKKKSTDNTGVILNFRHTGAKIVCKVQNTSSSLKFGVEGWKVGYLSPSGTFTFADANTDGRNTGSGTTLTFAQWSGWTAASVATEYASTFDKINIAASASATLLDGEMILVPQRITAATDYDATTANARLNGTFIAVKLYILNNANSELIAGGGTTASPTTIWAIWPIGDDGGITPFNWEPGKKYTYTIDLASGGYYEKNNNDSDDDLDPLLEGAEIKFVSVTVDDWTDVAKTVPQS